MQYTPLDQITYRFNIIRLKTIIFLAPLILGSRSLPELQSRCLSAAALVKILFDFLDVAVENLVLIELKSANPLNPRYIACITTSTHQYRRQWENTTLEPSTCSAALLICRATALPRELRLLSL